MIVSIVTWQLPVLLLLLSLLLWPLDVQAQNRIDVANKRFALDLYGKIARENQGKNVFFSPISISAALAMVFLGARGNTRQQMKTVLHLNDLGTNDDSDIYGAFQQLLLAVNNQNDTNQTLSIANRLFGSNGFQFQEKFLTDSEKYFQASLERLDFMHDSSGSRRHINDWVAKETNNKIKDLLADGTVDSSTKLVIVNAIYFKAFWTFPFESDLTKNETFHISKTESGQMPMMDHLQDKRLNYLNSTELNCEILEIPYYGDNTSMFIFLPNDVEGLSQVEQALTAEKLNELLSQVKPTTVDLKFPKFTMDQNISLKKFLQSLGIWDLFDSGRSDLSGMTSTNEGLSVADAVHKAYVSVNEIGTEAGAGTAIVLMGSSRFTTHITADRPFAFIILDRNTGTIFFLGRLVRPPTQGDSIGKFGETAPLTTQTGWTVRGNVATLVWSALVLLAVGECLRLRG